MPARALLVVFGGLPGTGKTTLACVVSERLGAAYLRIDSIEQAIRTSGVLPSGADLGPAGYLAACAAAADNLRMGRIVVVDSVNPIAWTRDAYRAAGEAQGAAVLEVEVVCSDPAEHRRRVETRTSDIDGLVLPTWAQVENRDYEPWNRPRLVVDTAVLSVEDGVARILDAVGRHRA
jgi:predicted kinase